MPRHRVTSRPDPEHLGKCIQERVSLTPEEEAAQDIIDAGASAARRVIHFQEMRSERNMKLAKSDWSQSSDTSLSNAEKVKWQTYRQELRDLPATVVDPGNPVWPTKP